MMARARGAVPKLQAAARSALGAAPALWQRHAGRHPKRPALAGGALALLALLFFLFWSRQPPLLLLSDPYLLHPDTSTVRVAWLTNFAGSENFVLYGNGQSRRANATTARLSRLAVRHRSRSVPVWRHEAIVTNLKPGERVPYSITSRCSERRGEVQSKTFTLQPAPPASQAIKVLLTSDHQNGPMVAANLQKVVEVVGTVDAVFFAGDAVWVPDKAEEWLGGPDPGAAFFPCLQGKARSKVHGATYRGGALLQHAPLYAAVGNHDVMGRRNLTNTSLEEQFEASAPRAYAEDLYRTTGLQLQGEQYEEWIANNSFNMKSYQELFPPPAAGSCYYSATLGSVRLIVLCAVRAYRRNTLDPAAHSRWAERQADLNHPERWRHGAFLFEPIKKGSVQYEWLTLELQSTPFQVAKHRVVMLHHPIHTLGENIGPAFCNPHKFTKHQGGRVASVHYEYPFPDYLVHDIAPLLEKAQVQLVYYGHSHLWNRFRGPFTHYLESSNVGNSFGAYDAASGRRRPLVDKEAAAMGDPNGLPAEPPTKPNASLGLSGPYVASNSVTVFSVLDTGLGVVRSYAFDTRQPKSPVVLFDELLLPAVTAPPAPEPVADMPEGSGSSTVQRGGAPQPPVQQPKPKVAQGKLEAPQAATTSLLQHRTAAPLAPSTRVRDQPPRLPPVAAGSPQRPRRSNSTRAPLTAAPRPPHNHTS
eukprot:EG_transcript_2950